MTAPAPEPTAPVATSDSTDAALILAVAAILSSGAGAGVTLAALRRLLTGLVSASAVRIVWSLVRATPPLGVYDQAADSAMRAEAQAEIQFRAAYVLNAAKRVDTELIRYSRTDPRQRIARVAAIERRFLAQHLQAIERRRQVAAAADRAARSYGARLGWHAVLDERTSIECRAAHGSNFEVGSRPLIGYPGAVHPHCRCRPGPPFRNGRLLSQRITARRLRNLQRQEAAS